MGALSERQRAIVDGLVRDLARVTRVQAVVLGGSYARDAARPGSDIDLGVYYFEEAPFEIDELRAVAAEHADTPDPVVTDFWEWGPWVNGGAWLRIGGESVDLLWRSLDHVERTIEAARRGEHEVNFGQQPPYGFASVVYLAETEFCRPLHDPQGHLARLKRAVAEYPRALAESIVGSALWNAQFTLGHARKFAAQGDVYDTAGCLTRCAAGLVQALFALNRVYFRSDKTALLEIETFARHPRELRARVERLLGRPGQTADELLASVDALVGLFDETVELAGPLYRPKYSERIRAVEERLG